MKRFNWINFLIAFVIFSGVFTVARHFYLKPDIQTGQKAPDFIALLPDGRSFRLSDLRGQYVLLDFWGSWCRPCIMEIPALTSLYEEFSQARFQDATGFSIVSVAIEKDRNRWLATIQRTGINWPYQIIDPTSNLKFFNSPIANEYGVRQVPTKFLINPKGIIEGLDWTPEKIATFLRERRKL